MVKLQIVVTWLNYYCYCGFQMANIQNTGICVFANYHSYNIV